MADLRVKAVFQLTDEVWSDRWRILWFLTDSRSVESPLTYPSEELARHDAQIDLDICHTHPDWYARINGTNVEVLSSQVSHFVPIPTKGDATPRGA